MFALVPRIIHALLLQEALLDPVFSVQTVVEILALAVEVLQAPHVVHEAFLFLVQPLFP